MISAPAAGLAQHSLLALSLRQELDRRRSERNPASLELAVQWIVPLCIEIAEIHRGGYGLCLHPANVDGNGQGGFTLSTDRAAQPPATPADRACLPPETVHGELGDAKASVYAVGAMLYEMVTGCSAGPNMQRPSEVVPGLPRALEVLLSNALIADPAHRSDDLEALAQAIYQLAPARSTFTPPPADVQRLSMLAIDVDVSLSMLPPPPAPVSGPRGAMGVGVIDTRQQPRGDTATAELASLKAQLESDPNPRYVVIKNGMDHGPFTAVELLRQIANHSFVADDGLLDQRSGKQQPIQDWQEFAPFADHAQRHRDIAAEKQAIDIGVAKEQKQTRGKALIGVGLVGVLLLGAVAWFLTQVGTRDDEVAVVEETVSNIEAEGALAMKKGKGGGAAGGKRVVGNQGGIPILAGGMSCEAAQSAYVEELSMKGGGQADITRGQYGNVLNNGSYLNGCGVPSNVAVSICAAVQGGRAVGVTVTTKPNHGSAACISKKIRSMSFPSHPKLDVVRVNFAAQ